KTMKQEEWRGFLSSGTRTAKLASRRFDGRPHVTPVWFVLDGDDLVFTTQRDIVKGRNIRNDPRVMLCVDDERPPFAFDSIEGTAGTSELPPGTLVEWTPRIAPRYIGHV